jgi:hypothetical protein
MDDDIRTASRETSGVVAAVALLLMCLVVVVAGVTAPAGRDSTGARSVALRHETRHEWASPALAPRTAAPFAEAVSVGGAATAGRRI